jgi:alpha-methylacyl-CoA racemase
MGPLQGIKVVEFGGIGAVPFCGQMLADMGATVIRIERKDGPRARLGEARFNTWFRNRRAVYLDFSEAPGKALLFKMMATADATIEGFRPGVMERLGLGPDECLHHNPKLIYGRLTGYGRDGEEAFNNAAGHDINYLALSGGLNAIGNKGGRPVPPLNLLADLGGGGLMLAFGVVCAILERQQSGRGQVVDAAMVDGCAALLGAIYGWWAGGVWEDGRGRNLFDSGAPFYDTYETSDSKFMALGSFEPEFYATVLARLGIEDVDSEDQMDRAQWPALRERLSRAFKLKSRSEWCAIFEGADTCTSPVLSFSEAIHHPHNVRRNTFVAVDGVMQPAPTPRFSRTRPEVTRPPQEPGTDVCEAFLEWGFEPEEIKALQDEGIV